MIVYDLLLLFADSANPIAVFVAIYLYMLESCFFQGFFKFWPVINGKTDCVNIISQARFAASFVDDEELSAFFECAIDFGKAFFQVSKIDGLERRFKVKQVACKRQTFHLSLHNLQTSAFYRTTIFLFGQLHRGGREVDAHCVEGRGHFEHTLQVFASSATDIQYEIFARKRSVAQSPNGHKRVIIVHSFKQKASQKVVLRLFDVDHKFFLQFVHIYPHSIM